VFIRVRIRRGGIACGERGVDRFIESGFPNLPLLLGRMEMLILVWFHCSGGDYRRAPPHVPSKNRHSSNCAAALWSGPVRTTFALKNNCPAAIDWIGMGVERITSIS